MSYQWLTLAGYLHDFLRAGWLTLQITLLAFALALAVGLAAAVAGA
jgi:polar amino acid transport system permease protein